METKNEIEKKEEMNSMNNDNKNMLGKLQEMIKLSDEDLKNISFFKDAKNIYVRYPAGEYLEVSNLHSTRFKNWLFKNSINLEFKKLGDKVDELYAIAEFDSTVQEREVYTRLAFNSGKIYYCLHNETHKVVEVDGSGWRIINEHEAPVIFISEIARAVPEPEHGGSINNLREFINTNDDDFILIIGWAVAAFNINIDRPILWINGEKGCGKTELSNFLKNLIDPDTNGILAPFNSTRDFEAVSSSRYIICLDNISKITQALSNNLCRTVTGAGFAHRQLYTDNTALSIMPHNALIINGKNLMPPYDDLEDRCFCVNVKTLNAQNRKGKQELNEEFDKKRPTILGALLDAVSTAMRKAYDNTKGDTDNNDIDVRMIDACRFIMKAAKADNLPFSDNDFKKIVEKRYKEANSYDISTNLLANIIYNMFEEKRQGDSKIIIYSGTVRGLFSEVQKRVQSAEKRDLPKDIKTFGRQLRIVMENILNKYDIYAEYKRDSQSRKVTITYAPPVNDKTDAQAAKEQNSGESSAYNQSVNEPDADNYSADEQNKSNDNKVDSDNATEDMTQKAPAMSLPPEKKKTYTCGKLFYIDLSNKTLKPNSGETLYTPLTNLSTDMMLQMVLSNGFVPFDVKYNTIIWENWEIFATAEYLWKVVRKDPLIVTTWCYNREFYACKPSKQNNLYIASHYNSIDTVETKLTAEPVTLELAIKACEQNLTARHSCGRKNICGQYSPSNPLSASYVMMNCKITDWDNRFKKLNFDDENIALLSKQNPYIRQIALDTITQDVEPTNEQIKEIIGKYRDTNLLNKGEIQEVINNKNNLSGAKKQVKKLAEKSKESESLSLLSPMDFVSRAIHRQKQENNN